MLYGIIKTLVCLFVVLTIPLSIAWTLQSPTRPPHARYLVALSLSLDSSERDELSIEDRNEAASQNVLEDDATSVSGTRGATKRRRLQSRPIRRDSTNSNLPMNRMQQERNEQIQKAQERYMEALKDPTLFANGSTQSNSNNSSHFDTIQPKISSATMRAIHEVLLLRQMTEIQCRTFPMAVQGASVLGRARTGTGKVCPSLVPFFVIGVSALFLTHVSHNIYMFYLFVLKKTIAYLLPAIERLLQMDNKIFRPGRTIGIIIVAPTRELVIQISQEATKLLTFHHGYTVQPLYGGISIQRDRAILFHRPIPTILVSTPGRLYDLLRDSSLFRVHGNRNFVDVVNECPIVIFDEADRLMEGFTTEINTISSYLPRIEKRQTMLFSATISLKLKHVLQNGYPKMLPSEYASVDCVKDDDITTHINQRVSQTFVLLADMRSYVSGFLSIVDSLMKNDNNSQSNTKKSKVLIFLPTAKLVKFFKEVLNHISLLSSGQGYDVYSIHSRMSQGSRNRASTQFRAVNNKNCILLSSDVSARGVDYPDVTFVVQVRISVYVMRFVSVWWI